MFLDKVWNIIKLLVKAQLKAQQSETNIWQRMYSGYKNTRKGSDTLRFLFPAITDT